MSTATKKFLMYGGIAAVGYLVYSRLRAPTPATPAAVSSPPLMKPPVQVAQPTSTSGLLAELGLEQSLGSLRSSFG